MSTLRKQQPVPARATGLTFSDVQFTVALTDGRYLTVPLWWYPRLEKATATQRTNWKLLGKGIIIHWPELDEFIEVEHLVRGLKSVELRDVLVA